MRLGGRAVDFVGQQQLREDRAGAKAKFLLLHVEDRCAGDVRGHQVGGELDAAELAAEHAAQRADEQRLAQAGHAFDQHVAAGEQGDERAQHEFLLADVDVVDLGEDFFKYFTGGRLFAAGVDRGNPRLVADFGRLGNLKAAGGRWRSHLLRLLHRLLVVAALWESRLLAWLLINGLLIVWRLIAGLGRGGGVHEAAPLLPMGDGGMAAGTEATPPHLGHFTGRPASSGPTRRSVAQLGQLNSI